LAIVRVYLPAEKMFVVRAGVGWGEGVVGKVRVGADLASPAGFALQTGKPVISNHLENEERFRTPELLESTVIDLGDVDPNRLARPRRIGMLAGVRDEFVHDQGDKDRTVRRKLNLARRRIDVDDRRDTLDRSAGAVGRLRPSVDPRRQSVEVQ